MSNSPQGASTDILNPDNDTNTQETCESCLGARKTINPDFLDPSNAEDVANGEIDEFIDCEECDGNGEVEKKEYDFEMYNER